MEKWRDLALKLGLTIDATQEWLRAVTANEIKNNVQEVSIMSKPNIEVYANYVVVCGVRIPRPPGIAPSQWLAFWEEKVK